MAIKSVLIFSSEKKITSFDFGLWVSHFLLLSFSMHFPEFCFVMAAYGSYQDRTVVSLSDYNNIIKKKELGKEHHRSIGRFGIELNKYYHSKLGTVSEFKGAYILDYLPIDIDFDDILQAVGSLFKLRDSLKNDKIWRNFHVWASGSKGFHLLVPVGLFQPVPHHWNLEAGKLFLESLLPAQFEGSTPWLGTKQQHSPLDAGLYQSGRLLRQGQSKGKKGYKVLLNEQELAELEQSPETIHQLWEKPNGRGLTDDYLTGEIFWQYEPVPELVELWKECVERVANSKEGVKFHGGKSNGNAVSYEIQAPQCIKNILAAAESGTLLNRNNAMCILTQYFSKTMPPAATKAAVREINNNARNPLRPPEDDLEASMHSVLTKGYPFACGRADSHLSPIYYCNENATLDQCPEVQKRQSSTLSRVYDCYDAYTQMEQEVKKGPSRIRFGIPEVDEITGPFVGFGDICIFQGPSGVSKSAIVFRINRTWVEIARKMDMSVVLISLDQDHKVTARRLTQQMAGYTQSELFEHAMNGGIKSEVKDWFMDYKDTFHIINGRGLSADELMKKLTAMAKKKPIMSATIDPASYLTFDPVSGRLIAAAIARQFQEFFKSNNILSAIVLHTPKLNDDKVREQDQAYGTVFWSAMADYVFSVKDTDNRKTLRLAKAKERGKGFERQLPKDPIPMCSLDWYDIISKREAEKLRHTNDFIRNWLIEQEAMNGL